MRSRADPYQLPAPGRSQCVEERRHQRPPIGEPVRSRPEDDDHDVEAGQVLRAAPSRRRSDDQRRGLLEKGDDLLPRDRGGALKEVVDRLPSSRHSTSVWTGTRVPANTGAPPSTSGEEVTIALSMPADHGRSIMKIKPVLREGQQNGAVVSVGG